MQNLIEEMYKMLPSLPAEISTLVPKDLDKIYAEYRQEDELMRAEFKKKIGEQSMDPDKKYIGSVETPLWNVYFPMNEEDYKDPSKIDYDNRILDGIIDVAQNRIRGTFRLIAAPDNKESRRVELIDGILRELKSDGKQEMISYSRISQDCDTKPRTVITRERDQSSTVVKVISYMKHNVKSIIKIREHSELKKLDFFIPNGPDIIMILSVIHNPAGGVIIEYRNAKYNDTTKTILTSHPMFRVNTKDSLLYLYPMLTSADNEKRKVLIVEDKYKYVGEVDGKFVPNGHGKQTIEVDAQSPVWVAGLDKSKFFAQSTLVLEGEFVNNVFVEGRMIGGDALFEGKFESADRPQRKGKGRLLLGVREQLFDEHFNRIKPGQSKDPSLKYFSAMYEGEVLNLLMHGKGILHVEQGTTEGEFINNKAVGRHIHTDLQGLRSEVFYAAPSSNHSPSQMPPSQQTHKFSSRPLIQTPHLTPYLHSTISMDLAASDRPFRRMIIPYHPPRTMTHPRYLTQLFRFGLRILK